MKTNIIYIKGTFHGLYKWGEGWSEETRAIWKNYWQNAYGIFWKYFCHKQYSSNEIDYLVCNGGSLFLHPMNFSGGLFGGGVKCNGKYFESQIDELKRLCEECAKVCGGTFTMEVSDEIPIEVELAQKV